MWKETSINLGIIPASVNQTIIFEYTGDKKITDITTSCGCSNAIYKDGKLIVTFYPAPVPQHIALQGKDTYTTTKIIKLREGTEFKTLSFTATIKSK